MARRVMVVRTAWFCVAATVLLVVLWLLLQINVQSCFCALRISETQQRPQDGAVVVCPRAVVPKPGHISTKRKSACLAV